VAVLVYEKVLGWRSSGSSSSSRRALPVIVGVLFSTFFLPSGLVDKALSPLGLEASRGCPLRGAPESS